MVRWFTCNSIARWLIWPAIILCTAWSNPAQLTAWALQHLCKWQIIFSNHRKYSEVKKIINTSISISIRKKFDCKKMYLFTRQNHFFLFDNRAEVERLSIVCSVAHLLSCNSYSVVNLFSCSVIELLSCLVARLLIIFLTGALECHGRLGLPGWSGTNSWPKVSKNDISFCKFHYLWLDYCQGAQSAFKNYF